MSDFSSPIGGRFSGLVWGFTVFCRLQAFGSHADRLRSLRTAGAYFGDIIRKVGHRALDSNPGDHVQCGVPWLSRSNRLAARRGTMFIGRDPANSGRFHRNQSDRAMQNTNLFPNMVTQMVAIGEESGSIRCCQGGRFLRAEVDDAVEASPAMMEPMIMVVLGVLIGGMVIAMYLPIFKLGAWMAADAGLSGRLGRHCGRARPLPGQFSERRHPSPAANDGARVAVQCAELRDEPAPDSREPLDCPPLVRAAQPADTQSPPGEHPLLSYFCSEACSSLKSPISLRYPAIEATTASSRRDLPGTSVTVGQTIGACPDLGLIALSTLPSISTPSSADSDNATAVLAGPAVQSVRRVHRPARPSSAPWRVICSLWSVFGFRLATVTGRKAWATVTSSCLAALGAWLGWQMLPAIVLISSLGASVGFVIVFARHGRNIPIPLAPIWLRQAGLIALVWGNAPDPRLSRLQLG